MTYLFLLLGLFILVVGAELLVRGAVALAELGRISPLVIGLTVVAFGTSAPELAVSSVSTLEGDSSIALGNVLGSNIFNVLFILGLSAVIVPLSVSSQLVRLDVPIMIAASIGVWCAAYDGVIQRGEGACMFVAFLIYTAWLIRAGRKESRETDLANEGESDQPVKSSMQKLWGNIALLVIGLVLLVWGAQLLVDSATTIAQAFGVSDLVIGLTIVAAGTSLPELATSVVAAMKGQRDIAVGNVVGSNVFNLLMVLATASILSKDGIAVSADVLWFDLAVMVFVGALCWPVFVSHGTVSRGEGIIMVLLYCGYTGLLIAASMQVESIEAAKSAFVFALLPVVLLSVSVLAWRAIRASDDDVNPRVEV